MPPTPCACPGPGYCPRHRCDKPPHWHELCRTRLDYFRLWEEGRGPGQGTLTRPALPPPCRHRGAACGERPCPSCRGPVRVKLFDCALHGECTLALAVPGMACCAGCADQEPPAEPGEPSPS